ncbi:hypothetical protein AMTRI_Chr09g21070 [Amborella trichopoda]
MASTIPRVSFNLRVNDGKRCRIRVEEEEIHQTKTSSEEEPTPAILRNLFELSIDSGSHITIEVADKESHPTKTKKQDQSKEARSPIQKEKLEHTIVNKAEVPFDCRGPRVFFDITIGGVKAGLIVMELYSDVVPMTAENFRALCTGEKGKAPNGKSLHYKGSSFHTVIPGRFCVGGDCTGGESIYGGKFIDENFKERHKGFGVLFMSNGGERDNNCSKFAISTNRDTGLDGKYVVFGRVVEGLDVVRAIENVGSPYGEVLKPVLIADCGQI